MSYMKKHWASRGIESDIRHWGYRDKYSPLPTKSEESTGGDKYKNKKNCSWVEEVQEERYVGTLVYFW